MCPGVMRQLRFSAERLPIGDVARIVGRAASRVWSAGWAGSSSIVGCGPSGSCSQTRAMTVGMVAFGTRKPLDRGAMLIAEP
jgi:hypothetical protein